MANSVMATWLGHSTFLLQSPEGKTVLIDPWVKNNPACPPEMKKLPKVDVVLCTHGHFDHIGDAVEICQEHNPVVVGIFELCAWLNKKGCKQISPMNKGGSQNVAGVRVTLTDAKHSSGIQGDDGNIVYGGEPCGLVVEFSNGLKVYHAGDTAVFGDMALIRELYAPQVVMLPIGDHFVMGPREVEVACRLLRPKVLVPMHYGTFPVLTGKPGDLAKAAKEQGFEILEFKPGERKELPTGQLVSSR